MKETDGGFINSGTRIPINNWRTADKGHLHWKWGDKDTDEWFWFR